MTRKSKAEYRIQKAVTGIIINTMDIPRVYKHAEKLIAEGADDAQLRAGICKFTGHPE